MWIQTGVRVRKRLSLVLTSVTLTFDLWPWPFAWTSLLTMVITPENFMMIRWWEHGEKGVTDGQTDGQTDRQTDRQTENTICRAAWSQLKNKSNIKCLNTLGCLYQYMASKNKNTEGDCPPPPQIEVSAHLWKNWSQSKMVFVFTVVDIPDIGTLYLTLTEE